MVTVPSNHNVGSGPREYISLRIVDTTKVLIPVSLGRVETMTDDTNMATQISTDMEDPSSKQRKIIYVIKYLNYFNINNAIVGGPLRL